MATATSRSIGYPPSEAIRSSSAWCLARAHLGGPSRSNVEMWRCSMRSIACSRVIDARCECRTKATREACAGQLALSSSASGKRAAIDRLDRREVPVEPELAEVRRVERDDDEPAVGAEHAAQLAKRARPVDEMADEPQDGALEPAVANGGPPPCPAPTRPMRGRCRRPTEHLRLGIDAPDLRGGGSLRAPGSDGPCRSRSPARAGSEVTLATTSSKTSRQLPSTGRTRSYSAASRPKSGASWARVAPGDAPAVELERPHLRHPGDEARRSRRRSRGPRAPPAAGIEILGVRLDDDVGPALRGQPLRAAERRDLVSPPRPSSRDPARSRRAGTRARRGRSLVRRAPRTPRSVSERRIGGDITA